MRIVLRFLLARRRRLFPADCLRRRRRLAERRRGTAGQRDRRIRHLDLYEDADRLSAGVAPFTAGRYEDLDKGVHDFSIRGGVAGATIATLRRR